MVQAEIREKLREFSKVLRKKGIRITKIILYGSYAAGTFHKDSDIDVAIISPDFGRDRFEEGVELFEIACKIDPRLEPVPVSLESFKKNTWLPLIYEIREKGVEVKIENKVHR